MRVVFVRWFMDKSIIDIDNETWTRKHMPAGNWKSQFVDDETGEVEFDGELDEDEYHAFLNEWGLNCEVCNNDIGDASFGSMLYNGRMYDAIYHTLDGMDWNAGGWTPVKWVDVIVSEPIKED